MLQLTHGFELLSGLSTLRNWILVTKKLLHKVEILERRRRWRSWGGARWYPEVELGLWDVGGGALGHYVRSSYRIHISETLARAVVSGRKKGDTPASAKSGTGSVEGRKEMILFLACLN
jgi:hypothetical protein